MLGILGPEVFVFALAVAAYLGIGWLALGPAPGELEDLRALLLLGWPVVVFLRLVQS